VERLAFVLFIAGFLLILMGSIAMIFCAIREPATSGSVIIVIGPIPIVGAWGEHGILLTLVAVILFFVLLAVHLLYLRKLVKIS